MTENEAIKDIQFLARRYDDLQEVNMSVSQESLDMAIQALEEIQQYRAIGTVEKIKEELDRLRNDNECQGLYFTLEERKALAKQSRELSEYKQIGTIEEFKALKEKSEPKKILKCGDFYKCPVCNHWVGFRYRYCDGCGQKLDWSE